MSSIWRIPGVPKREKRDGHHPTQKPLRLVRRALMASSRESELGRFFVEAELKEEFCELAERRIRAVVRGSVLRNISGRLSASLME